MQIKPMIRNNICLNSHPKGCLKMVQNQIEYVRKTMAGLSSTSGAPKLALVIGCSTGYGLASRIGAAFGYGAVTVGISFEKAGSPTKPGTPGWYDNLAFDAEAAKAGLISKTLDGDAFSNEMKDAAIAAIREVADKAGIPPQIDLVIYSLASPVRTDPRDGVMYRSVIKPIGQAYSGKTMDMLTGKISIASAEPATEEEIAHTVKVMGGEDWELWIKAIEARLTVVEEELRLGACDCNRQGIDIHANRGNAHHRCFYQCSAASCKRVKYRCTFAQVQERSRHTGKELCLVDMQAVEQMPCCLFRANYRARRLRQLHRHLIDKGVAKVIQHYARFFGRACSSRHDI